MKFVGITVCVNYAPILRLALQETSQRLDHIIVVTKKDDIDTIKVCEGYNNVDTVFFDFSVDERWFETHMKRFKNGEMNNPPDMRKQYWSKRLSDANVKGFNKGGGLRLGQQHVVKNYPGSVQIILDCDIVLPPEFKTATTSMDYINDVLYVPNERRDYTSYTLYKQQKTFKNYSTAGWGYFQMYRPSIESNRVFYDDWPDAAKTDVWFRNDILKGDFKKKIKLNTHVDHLGQEGGSIHLTKYNFDFN